MAVRKSTMVTQIDAGVLQMPAKFGGDLNRISESHAKGAADETGDIYPVMRVWTGWVPDSLVFRTAAWGASGVAEIGIYETAENGGAAIDADCFASAVDVSSALAAIDLMTESGVIGLDEINNTIRDILGIAATVAHRWVNLCVTATHIGAGQAAKFNLTLRYIEKT